VILERKIAKYRLEHSVIDITNSCRVWQNHALQLQSCTSSIKYVLHQTLCRIYYIVAQVLAIVELVGLCQYLSGKKCECKAMEHIGTINKFNTSLIQVSALNIMQEINYKTRIRINSLHQDMLKLQHRIHT
jgi:hypothetical protein